MKLTWTYLRFMALLEPSRVMKLFWKLLAYVFASSVRSITALRFRLSNLTQVPQISGLPIYLQVLHSLFGYTWSICSQPPPRRRDRTHRQMLLPADATAGLEGAKPPGYTVIKSPNVNQKPCLGAFSLLETSYLQEFLSDQRKQPKKAPIF